MEKCMSGKYYDCHNEIFLHLKAEARSLLKIYNSLAVGNPCRVIRKINGQGGK